MLLIGESDTTENDKYEYSKINEVLKASWLMKYRHLDMKVSIHQITQY